MNGLPPRSPMDLYDPLPWVNEQRARFGIGDPLDALPDDTGSLSGDRCPLGEALGAPDPDSPVLWLTSKDMRVRVAEGEPPTIVPLPDYIRVWITARDERLREAL